MHEILERFVGEFQNLRHQTTGGHGDAARTKAEAPLRVHDGEGADEIVVVRQGFAHPHHHDVVERGQLGAGARRALVLAITDMQQLRHDFPGFEVALQSRQAAGAT